jgi:hypothetical protein
MPRTYVGPKPNPTSAPRRPFLPTIGSQTVLRLQCHESPERAATSRQAPAWDFTRIPVSSPERRDAAATTSIDAGPTPSSGSPELTIGDVDDTQERAADRAAADVMRMPTPAPCPPGALPRLSQDGAGAALGGAAPALVPAVLRSSGQPLDTSTRVLFESRFQRDFGDVRVHTGQAAAESAASVGALAYTAGSHVVFAEGQWAPRTLPGRRLIAHELAHVVQQRGSVGVLQRQPAAVSKPAALPDTVPGLGPARTKEVEDLVNAGDRQGAVDTLVGYKYMDYEIDLNLLLNKRMIYDPTVTWADGTTAMPSWDYLSTPQKAVPARVRIGPSAFTSVAYLYSVIMHEYQHVLWQQALANQQVSHLLHAQNLGTPDEVKAGAWELLHATETGVARLPDKIAQIWANLNDSFWKLDAKAQASERPLVLLALQKAKDLMKGSKLTLVPFASP